MGKTPSEVGRYERERYPEEQEIVVTEVDVRAVPQHPEDPEQIQAEIEQTRAEMSETIDAIQDRLSPQHLKQQAKDTVREQLHEAKDYVYDATVGRAEQTAKGVGSSMMDTIKQNPIPAAIAWLSLGYMFMKSSGSSSNHHRAAYYDYREPRYGYYESSSSGGVRQQASQYAHEAKDQASYYAGQAQHQAQESADWMQQKLHENPLTVAAIALAVGAALGLAVPETQTENQLMGETRDSVMEQAKSMGQDVMHKAQHVAEEAKDSAKQAAKQQGLTS
ncbi:MAG: DUF3618 domain-containing protein [Chloroflexota bacterium]|nr:DUF3618 domain-containing protein [Chloroflexota bacterium]